MITNIETVCQGNNGRSPVAEAAARNVVFQRGLQNRVVVQSSGTIVNKLNPFDNDPELIEQIKKVTPVYIKQGFVHPGFQAHLNAGNYAPILTELMSHERSYRLQYLQENGFPTEHKPEQTVYRPEAQLILPADKRTENDVKGIYSGTENQPEILTLSDYDPDGFEKAKDEYWKLPSYDHYKALADLVKNATVEFVEQALG